MARTINEYLRLIYDRIPSLVGGRIPVDTGSTAITAFSRYDSVEWSGAAVVIKAGAGSLYRLVATNPNTVPVYLKISNSTTATPGTTVPQTRLVIPPAMGAMPGFLSADLSGQPYETYTTGITAWAVTGIADNSSALPASTLSLEVRFV